VREVLFRELQQQPVELRALLGAERGEQLLLDASRAGAQVLERAPAGVGERDDVAPAVGRVAAALDEAALLELVEQPDQLSAVVAERVGDRALRLARALASTASTAWWYGPSPSSP
jgi:hypothetical protein